MENRLSIDFEPLKERPVVTVQRKDGRAICVRHGNRLSATSWKARDLGYLYLLVEGGEHACSIPIRALLIDLRNSDTKESPVSGGLGVVFPQQGGDISVIDYQEEWFTGDRTKQAYSVITNVEREDYELLTLLPQNMLEIFDIENE